MAGSLAPPATAGKKAPPGQKSRFSLVFPPSSLDMAARGGFGSFFLKIF
jgi:hypothetical protein